MKDDRLGILGRLNLIKGDGDREPAGSAARRELADAQASQRRLDAMGQGAPEEEPPEDEEEAVTPEQIMSAAMEAEVDHLRAENETLRRANIALNARLVESESRRVLVGRHPDRDDPST